jgi:hypothetical protein
MEEKKERGGGSAADVPNERGEMGGGSSPWVKKEKGGASGTGTTCGEGGGLGHSVRCRVAHGRQRPGHGTRG